LASFDLEADHENIIVNKILPMINEEGLWLLVFSYHDAYHVVSCG
jgi:hypothetical protein